MASSGSTASPPHRRLPGGFWLWLLGGGTLGWALLGFVVLVSILGATVTQPPQCGQGAAVGLTVGGSDQIPSRLVAFYQGAAARFGLGPDGWLYLASINKTETEFGSNQNTSSAGARGPMQFMPATWATQGIDGDGDGRKDILNEADAIYGAANYLHASGAPGDWQRAIFAYNHAGWYVDKILANVARWGGDPGAAVSAEIVPAVAPSALGALPGSPAGSGGLDVAAATAAAQARSGQVSFAVASSTGALLASHDPDRKVNGRSITKAMLLVAYLTDLDDRPVPAADRPVLEAMIGQSDNAAANRIYRKVGRSGVAGVADKASMTSFRVRDTGDAVYLLGLTQVTAGDQARFFAMVDQLVPATHRGYALGLLKGTNAQWGLPAAGYGPLAAKAGWAPEAGGAGWTVNQGAQLQLGDGAIGVAVVTSGQPSFAYGQQSIEQVGRTLKLDQANSGVAAMGTAACAGSAVDAAAGMTLSPGERATVLPDGTATVPAQAPPEVQAIIVAANKIVQRFPYVYGGGHAPGPSMDQKRPQPAGGGYDCSSTVSYALWGAGPRMIGLLANSPQASPFLMTWGDAGPGKWVTTHSNRDHVFMEVAGIWLNTGSMTNGTAPKAAGADGPHWGNAPPPAGYDSTFVKRHPPGL